MEKIEIAKNEEDKSSNEIKGKKSQREGEEDKKEGDKNKDAKLQNESKGKKNKGDEEDEKV